MAWKLNGSSDGLLLGSAAASGVPFTLACWGRPDSASSTGTILAICNSATAGNYATLGQNAGAVLAQYRDSLDATQNATAGAVAAGVWQHYAAVYASLSSRTAYHNGAAGTPNAVSMATATYDRTSLGYLQRTTGLSYFGGHIAHAAVWSVALTAAEIASLAAGRRPDTVRPESLVEYWPLSRRRPMRGARRSLALAPQGSPAVSDGPAMLEFRDTSLRPAVLAGALPAPTEVSLWGCGAISFGGFRMAPDA